MSSVPPPPPGSQPPPPAWPPSEPGFGKPWWKRWWGITLVGFGSLVVFAAIFGEPEDSTDPVPIEAAAEEAGTETEPAPSPSPSRERSSPSPRPSPTSSPTPDPTPTLDVATVRNDGASLVLAGVVANVVDGDTIDLEDGTRVRLAIVDTAEVHGGNEPCGPEASAFTRRQVLGEHVSILRPAGAPGADSFGRLLGEVVRADGVSLNVELVAAGFGTIDDRFVGEDPDLAGRLAAAQEGAVAPSCAVAETPPPAPDPEPELKAPVAPVAPEPDPEPAGDCAAGYDPCVAPYPPDLNCSDVSGPIYVDHAHGDPHGFDRDKDGVGCEG